VGVCGRERKSAGHLRGRTRAPSAAPVLALRRHKGTRMQEVLHIPPHKTRMGPWQSGANQHGHSGIAVLVEAVVEIPVTPSNDSSPDVSMKAMSCSSS